MADIISAICAVAQCFKPASSFFIAKAEYVTKFDANLDDLRTNLGYLRAKRDRVLPKVVAEERRGWQRLDEVQLWLSRVQVHIAETNSLVTEATTLKERRSASCGCCSNIISTYSCGKRIFEMLKEVKSLLSTGNFDAVAEPAPPPVVLEEPDQQTFGLDEKLQSTWSRLMDPHTKMLGLYGMGGVGKTTLLNLISKKFGGVEKEFDVVIWVKVGKDADIGKIQDDIGKRLGLYDENWCQKPQREKNCDISRVLTEVKPRFVLLLDDLWEEVSLSSIGIPLQGREYKVVFTTRFKDVCGSMGANEDIKVPCLGEKDAWDLFKLKARCGGLSGEISDIAEKIAANCCGLPLALEVIGKSLASKTTVDEWRRALNTLESCPSELKGTEKRIFQVLKLSYDYLEKKDAKLCFQYCALFPKAYYMKQDELVEYWIGEGIINEEDGRQRAKERGCNIIDTLVEASLLLKDGEARRKVYMHDMIREMALSIVSEIRDGERFVVKTDAGLSRLPNVTDWTTVTKISLMNNEIQSIPDSHCLPNPDRLKTLFLQNNKLVHIVGRFFLVMSTLVVLDLSQNLNITELPEDITKLVALRYLNLLETGIKHLPSSFGALDKLIHLDLESTSDLRSISLISRLLKLQVLRFYRSAPLDHSFLESLECLEDLKLLTITVEEDFKVLEAFLGSNSAGRTEGLYLNRLEVSGVSGKSFAATFGELGNLSKLGMTECNIIESQTEWEDNRRNQYSPSTSSHQFAPSTQWFKNLSSVVLLSCEHLRDVTWLIYAANLESLSITLSPKLEEVISQEKAGGLGFEPFLKLEVLCLEFLDELKSIYWSPLSFPRLHRVNIKTCPKLHKLPLNSTSAERIDDLRIEVDEGWLDEVEWENGAKDRFLPVIRTVSPVERRKRPCATTRQL